jgi:predicted flap endonuclease-1-like 5' DNA nuclease
MADVDWKKYDCSICLMIGLICAAILTGLIAWLLHQAGLSVILLSILTVVIAAVLFWAVDQYCAGRAAGASAYAGAAAVGGASVAATDTSDADAEAARAAEAKAAAERAAAEKAAADQAAREAEANAAAEKAAAEQAAAEEAARQAEAEAAAKAAANESGDYDGDGVVEGENEGTRPEALDGPRGGVADDLKRVKGIGPKMEKICNSLGFYHFDQIAAWSADEVAWVDANLEGFKGRVTRDEWVAQAKLLAAGEETEFSKRVDDGDVPSSQ